MTVADLLCPVGKRRLMYEIALIIGGSIFIVLSAQIAVPLPFSTVPITGQTLAVLMVGMLFGSRRGTITLLTYLSEGMIGLPVFAGGSGGIAHLLGPTGGYLFGFIATAFVTGSLSERRWDRKPQMVFFAMLIGNAIMYIFGLSWLSHFVGYKRVFALGLYPFISGDILKICVAITLLPTIWKILSKFGISK
ncbi:MAG: biotin transporter BioY [Thermotogae bacterium]|nr:biotin transporter BioY [Thermotogota bacterium]